MRKPELDWVFHLSSRSVLFCLFVLILKKQVHQGKVKEYLIRKLNKETFQVGAIQVTSLFLLRDGPLENLWGGGGNSI